MGRKKKHRHDTGELTKKVILNRLRSSLEFKLLIKKASYSNDNIHGYIDAIEDAIKSIEGMMDRKLISGNLGEHIKRHIGSFKAMAGERGIDLFRNLHTKFNTYPNSQVRQAIHKLNDCKNSKTDIEKFIAYINRHSPKTKPEEVARGLNTTVSEVWELYRKCKKAKVGIDKHEKDGFFIYSPELYRKKPCIEEYHI